MLWASLIVSVIMAIIFGIVSKTINENKGYYGGFAWGFWLGIIGIIVVACKPENKSRESFAEKIYNDDLRKERIVSEGGWKCNRCGRTNASYTTTCICGTSEKENKNWEKKEVKTSDRQTSQADELKKFKELLDSGAITQEEYNVKKKQLLNL